MISCLLEKDVNDKDSKDATPASGAAADDDDMTDNDGICFLSWVLPALNIQDIFISFPSLLRCSFALIHNKYSRFNIIFS